MKKIVYLLSIASVLMLSAAHLNAVCNNNAHGRKHAKPMGKKKTKVYLCATKSQSVYKGKMLALMYKGDKCARCGCPSTKHTK